jgi:Swiss Army Knife RNA repair-like protein
MNILMLDCDGVLNSKQHFLMLEDQKLTNASRLRVLPSEYMTTYTDAKNVWCLKYILENVPDLKIVISSSWRNVFELEQFKELFKHYGLDGERIIGKTPRKLSSVRSEEIRMWLDNSDEVITNWIALDDHKIWNLGDPEEINEVLTDPWIGLTMLDAFKIIKRFNLNFKEPILMI